VPNESGTSLVVSTDFLASFWDAIYYSVAVRCHLWGQEVTLLLETTCWFKELQQRAVDCRMLEEDLVPPVERVRLPAHIKTGAEWRDGSDVEQFARELKPGVILLEEDPGTFPPSRLERWVQQYYGGSRASPQCPVGIAHLHDSSSAELSEPDRQALIKLAQVAGDSKAWFLVLAYADVLQAVEAAEKTRAAFDGWLPNFLARVVIKAFSCAPEEAPNEEVVKRVEMV